MAHPESFTFVTVLTPFLETSLPLLVWWRCLDLDTKTVTKVTIVGCVIEPFSNYLNDPDEMDQQWFFFVLISRRLRSQPTSPLQEEDCFVLPHPSDASSSTALSSLSLSQSLQSENGEIKRILLDQDISGLSLGPPALAKAKNKGEFVVKFGSKSVAFDSLVKEKFVWYQICDQDIDGLKFGLHLSPLPKCLSSMMSTGPWPKTYMSMI